MKGEKTRAIEEKGKNFFCFNHGFELSKAINTCKNLDLYKRDNHKRAILNIANPPKIKKEKTKGKNKKDKVEESEESSDDANKIEVKKRQRKKGKKEKNYQENEIKYEESDNEEEEKDFEKKHQKRKKRKKSKNESSDDQESEDDNDKKNKKKKNNIKKKKHNKTKKEDSNSESESYEDDSDLENESDDDKNKKKENKKDKGLNDEDKLAKNVFEKNKIAILDIINFLEDNRIDIEMHKGGEKEKDMIKEFKNKYYIYKGIKRFAIPVIGCISSGKSTILNYLLNLKKILQIGGDIVTKCVCIIRHKKGCKKARIFNVDIQVRDNGFYNFEIKKIKIKKKLGEEIQEKEVEDEIKENVAEVIKKRNELIEKNKIGYDYNKYFLIVEYDIPFFRGELEKYADLFEFMDIPGLNEAPEANNNIKDTKDKRQRHIMKNFYFDQIFPLIQNNIKFSLFIFSAENYDGTNAKEILDSYIKIGIKEIQKKQEIKELSHSEKENERLKDKSEEEEKERHILNHIQTFKNSIFILNKLDHFAPEKRKEGIESFREYYKKYAKEIDLNLDDENQIGLIANKLTDGLAKLDSFKEYLKYYILYTKDKSYTNKITSFYDYMTEIMSKELKFKNKDDEEDKEEEEEEEEDEEDNEKRPDYMEKDDYDDYKELKNIADKNNDNIISFLSKKDYCKLKKIFENNVDNYDEENSKDDGLKVKLKNKMKKIIEDYFNIEKYMELKNTIIKDFNIDINKNSTKLINQRLQNLIRLGKGLGNPAQLINEFKLFIDKLSKFNENKKENKTITKLKEKYNNIYEYFLNTSAIRLLLVGPHNSGKSSLLNNIIGYNQNLLPTDLKECTKIGIIIKYAKKEERQNGIQMYKADFYQNEDGFNYFKYNETNKINLEGKTIKEKIEELNKENSNKEDLKFYLIKAPIEFLDQMESINEEEKERIELIDFPGLDTDFDKAKQKAEDLLKILDGFIYVNYQTAFSLDNKRILNLIYDTIKRRNDFSFDTCLFILNKIDLINEDIDYENVSKQILKIFDDSNKFSSSKDVIIQKQQFKDSELSLIGFSSLRYQKYKELNLLDFEKFIEINKKDNNGKNVIETIKNNLKSNYIEIKAKIFKKYEGNKNERKKYIKQLENILKKYKPNEEDLNEIVKLYMYILENRKKMNQYKNSNIDNLLKQFEKVIKETISFFERKRRVDVIKFLESSYIEILEVYNIVKITLKDENIAKFKEVEKNQELIKKEIENKALNLIYEIENKFSECQKNVENNTNSITDEYSFDIKVKENKEEIDRLVSNLNERTEELENDLKNIYKNIISVLNLEQLEQDKENFKNQMETLNNINFSSTSINKGFSKINNAVTRTVTETVKRTRTKQVEETYYETEEQSCFLTYLTLGLYWEKVHVPKTRMKEVEEDFYVDVDREVTDYYFDPYQTIIKYLKEIKELFFEPQKQTSIDGIIENKEETIKNIGEIFEKFNGEIQGFKDNFYEFEKIVLDVERFILKNTGLI